MRIVPGKWSDKTEREPSPDTIVRPMKIEDIDAIITIERASFPTPWSPHAFTTELRDNEYARYYCLEVNGRIIGYMGLWFILEEGHITNIAIAPEYRGAGWGEFLLRTVMDKMAAEGMERMTLEVRVSNMVAQKVYERVGFVKMGVRKKYYMDNQEDALIMWLDLE
ncbi:MAG: ribosomal protein S18-alanine N-acetyltransferase [Desulfitobacterium hafniense]|nr:ribosomal protein S18-alanine N-acetyltransferase [Desulfitobacterium hafniense]